MARGARVSDGEGDKLHPSPVLLEACDEGGVFSIFFSILASQPKSLQKPISTRIRVHRVLLNEVYFGEGASGTPLAYMRSGAVPWLAENSSRVSPRVLGSSGPDMRRGAVAHYLSPSAVKKPRRLYMGSCEKSV